MSGRKLAAACLAAVLLLVGCGDMPVPSGALGGGASPSSASVFEDASTPSFIVPSSLVASQAAPEEPEPLPEAVALFHAVNGPGYRQEMIYERSTREKDAMTSWVKTQLDALVAAGVLPATLVRQAQAYLDAQTVNFTRYDDSIGCVRLTCNFGLGTSPPYYMSFFYQADTDLVLSLDFSLPYEVRLTAEERRGQLDAYLAMLGLDALDDWQDYAGLWSAEQKDYFTPFMDAYGSESANLEASIVWHQQGEDDNFTCGCNVTPIEYDL